MYHKTASHQALAGCHSSILSSRRWDQPFLKPNPDCDSKDEAVTAKVYCVGTEIALGYPDQRRTWMGEDIAGQQFRCPYLRRVTEAKGRRHYHNKAFVACWLFTRKTKKRGKKKGGLIYLLKDPNSERGGKENYIPYLI